MKCAQFPGMYAFSDGYDAYCGVAISAGATVTCKPNADTASDLQKTCMDSSFDITCPKNNNAKTTMPFMKSKAVKCKACAGDGQAITDLNPQKGKYTVSLKWGRNMVNNAGTGTFFQKFSTWKVLMVDDYGRSYGEAGTATAGNNGEVDVKTTESSCCNPTEYQLNIKGSWATGATRFMIVPAVRNMNNTIIYHLPMGIMSNAFTDKETGSVTEHTGKLVIAVSDPAGFLKLPNRFEIMTNTLASSTGFPREYFHIHAITLGRRLAELDENLRRMAAHGGGLSVDYKVSIPDTYTGEKFSAKSIDTTKLSSNLVAHAQAAGMTNFKVTGVEVKAITTETVSGETTVTGGASPMAGVSSLIAVAMMLAGLHML